MGYDTKQSALKAEIKHIVNAFYKTVFNALSIRGIRIETTLRSHPIQVTLTIINKQTDKQQTLVSMQGEENSKIVGGV